MSREVKCGTWLEKGINSARCCINGYSMTRAPAKSVTHVPFRQCVYVTTSRERPRGSIKPDASQEWETWYVSRHRDDMQRDLSRLILRQRVRGSVRAVRAVRNTWVFLTETRFVANGAKLYRKKQQIVSELPL